MTSRILAASIAIAVVGCGLSVTGKRRSPTEEPEVADTPITRPPPQPTPSPVDAGPAIDPSALASIADYCAKCASCIASDRNFSDDFCDDHKSGDTFNLPACTAANDGRELGRLVSKRVLGSWSCDQFDDAQ